MFAYDDCNDCRMPGFRVVFQAEICNKGGCEAECGCPETGRRNDLKRRVKFNRGHWEVERERHRIVDRSPGSVFVESSGLDEILPGLFKRLGMEEHHWEIALQDEWESLVGVAVAKHSRPGPLSAGVLTVFVDSAVWLNQLKRYSRREMLGNIQGRFGKTKIRDLRFAPEPDDPGTYGRR